MPVPRPAKNTRCGIECDTLVMRLLYGDEPFYGLPGSLIASVRRAAAVLIQPCSQALGRGARAVQNFA